MPLSLNQRGASQIILPLFLIAAIGLAVYLAQNSTNIIPHAAESTDPPSGCIKITPGNRQVRYKNCSSSSESCSDTTALLSSNQEQDNDPNYKFDNKVVATYALKESVWDFGQGWKNFTTKGPRQPDGERANVSKSRFDGPNGKSYLETSVSEISGGNKVKYGDGQVIEYAFYSPGTNYQGLSGNRYDPSKSYAFVPSDSNSNTKCDGTGSKSGHGKPGDSCNNEGDCASGVCSNKKCTAQGNKSGGQNCDNGPQCQSGVCTNGKCEGGTRSNGSACDQNSDCSSNKCDSQTNKCVSASATATPRSSSGSSSGGNNSGGSNSGGTSASASPSPSSSSSPISSVAVGSPTPVSLTKAEITSFRNSYNALDARLGTASASGNLKIVSTIAKTELNSIVSELPTCPDDSAVGTCLDSKFRTRFDLAKTAARLSAFYAIFNNIPGICVKSDLGLNPLITATSQSGVTGRVNLCNDRLVSTKVWMIFANNAFSPILSTDTRFPANPTCQTLPQDVITHYRNAETLFKNQSGFVENTLCDGKTSVAGGGI